MFTAPAPCTAIASEIGCASDAAGPRVAGSRPGRGAAGWPAITTAFQPIVDVATGGVHAYEALVRSREGGDDARVLDTIPPERQMAFDQHCRDVAITDAARLAPDAPLSLNFRYVEARSCLVAIGATLAYAHDAGLRCGALAFEITENARMADPMALAGAIADRAGRWRFVLDDFGTGRSGLALLSTLRPDAVKLDRVLVHRAAENPASLAIVRKVLALARDHRIEVIAKGVERVEDADALVRLGVQLFQGFLYAPPAAGVLPVPVVPRMAPRAQTA